MGRRTSCNLNGNATFRPGNIRAAAAREKRRLIAPANAMQLRDALFLGDLQQLPVLWITAIGVRPCATI